MLDIKVNFHQKRSIGEQILAQLRRLIETNQMHPGDRLPPVRDLAQQLQVNFNTVARAYRILDQAGLITTQQGRGTYILDRADTGETLRDFSIEQFYNEINEQIEMESSRTGLTAGIIWRQLFQRHTYQSQDLAFTRLPVTKRRHRKNSKQRSQFRLISGRIYSKATNNNRLKLKRHPEKD